MSKEVGGCFPRMMFAFVFLDFKGVDLVGANLDDALFTPMPSALGFVPLRPVKIGTVIDIVKIRCHLVYGHCNLY
jgi:hypothetical protein